MQFRYVQERGKTENLTPCKPGNYCANKTGCTNCTSFTRLGSDDELFHNARAHQVLKMKRFVSSVQALGKYNFR